MAEIKSLIRDTNEAFRQKSKDDICELIMLEEGNPRLDKLQQELYNMTVESIRTMVQNELSKSPRPLKDFVSNFLIFTIHSALDTSALPDVYELLSACYGSFLSLYMAQDAQWLTPLLMNLSYSLVDWAILADKENPNAKELKISDAAAKHLSRAFNMVISDKTSNSLEDSKKVALYYLANLTFRLHSTRLMPTMLANISKAGVRLSDFPMSQQVTHRYYLGRYYLYQLDLRQAEKDLSFAFKNCPDPSQDEGENAVIYRNGRLILTYLTACRLCLGRIPYIQLLRMYDLDFCFTPLANAVKKGDLKLLRQALDAPDLMSWLVKKEIYFLLKEKLEVLCWRSLIRHVCIVSRGPTDPPQTRVSLEVLLDVVRALLMDNTYDIWDIESITASLLDQGYIKGYIHSQKKILVLGKTNPFPVVYSVEVIEDVLDKK
ncbi:hypothetical protein BGZ70_009394 [Mortierella alpina]|uniref:PCI domain-containing protein n=1 Tax=Mortierella alpina TaxID=64518 RepID=A0A9P6JDN1_MORAP|nr:hypothetical protein BGZ70_009394 [Mortierella alpina]